MRKIAFITIFGLVGLLVSCDVVNPEEEIPAYLYIKPFNLSTSSGQGTDSEKILYAWLFINNEFNGVYTLPATVPVLASGETSVQIFPGIKNNGIAASPGIYPFYKAFNADIMLDPTVIDTIQPTTTYEDDLVFAKLEDFEENHDFVVDRDGNGATKLEITNVPEDVFEGNGAGQIILTEEASFIEVLTEEFITGFPTTGRPVYLEFDYKNTINFGVGMLGQDDVGTNYPTDFLILRPTDTWNKIYFNLTDDVSQFSNFVTRYRIALTSEIPEDDNGNPEVQEGFIEIDNVKLLFFE